MPNTHLFSLTEIFNSIQGEGAYAGLYCTFVRFSGCNLECKFCDTDHKPRFNLELPRLIELIKNYTPIGGNVVFTGGEPLLQGNEELCELMENLLDKNINFHIETNGTIDMSPSMYNLFESVSMSPKTSLDGIKLKRCTSLKLLYPYLPQLIPEAFSDYLAGSKFIHPICPHNISGNRIDEYRRVIMKAIEELNRLPKHWRLDLQLHKLIQVL